MSVQSSSWQVLSISRAQRKVCLFLKAIKAHVITLPESLTAVGERHQEPEHGCWWHADLHTWRHQTRASCGQADRDPTMPPTSTRWSRSSPRGHLRLPKPLTASPRHSAGNPKYRRASSSTCNAGHLTQAHACPWSWKIPENQTVRSCRGTNVGYQVGTARVGGCRPGLHPITTSLLPEPCLRWGELLFSFPDIHPNWIIWWHPAFSEVSGPSPQSTAITNDPGATQEKMPISRWRGWSRKDSWLRYQLG